MSEFLNIQEDPELLAEFTIEAMAGLNQVDQNLLAMEQSTNDSLINEVFRAVHSVKGTAGFLGYDLVQALAHEFETILDLVRQKELRLNSEGIDAMLRTNDVLKSLLETPGMEIDIQPFVVELKGWKASQTTGSTSDSSNSVGTTSDVVARIEKSTQDIASNSKLLSQDFEDPSRFSVEASKRSVPDVIDAIKTTFGRTTDEETQSPSIQPTPLPDGTVAHSQSAVTLIKSDSAVEGSSKEEASTPLNSLPAATISPGPKATTHDSTIRVPVSVLEELVTLAGELVLSRNQLMRMIHASKLTSFAAIGSRIDQVTTAMQDSIMSARMQQVSILFNRFPRLVRDLNQKLHKRCRLLIEGGDVELDKTILEALSDPLTHLLRNSLDHGIEIPEKRKAIGKPAEGTLQLKAFHEGGKVRIIIEDDGAGVNRDRVLQKAIERGLVPADTAHRMSDREIVNLIFKPGFSTADTISDVSGRGVGMDVVRTNIERIGGTVDVESDTGKGAKVHITLPLTLAIIPSWIVQQDNFRFAIPEASVIEFISLTPADKNERLEKINDSEMVRWRGGLLPLLRLRECLPPGCRTSERRQNINKVVVIETGIFQFGLAVEQVCDPEHVVVKPIGNHLGQCGYLEGVAVLGDGNVAYILGMQGIAETAKLGVKVVPVPDETVKIDVKRNESQAAVLIRRTNGNLAAIPRMVLQRIERVDPSKIQDSADRLIMAYRGEQLQILELEPGILQRIRRTKQDFCYVTVFSIRDKEVGLVVPEIIDIREISTQVSLKESIHRAICGTVLVDEMVVELLDVYAFADQQLIPITNQDPNKTQWSSSSNSNSWQTTQTIDLSDIVTDWTKFTVLLAEDTPFFRNQVRKYLELAGLKVCITEDGQQAWDYISDPKNKVDLLLTDIEMPNLDGFELALKVRSNPRLQDMPIVAITSLHTEASQRRGREVGIDDWQVKLDRDKLIFSIQKQLLAGKRINQPYSSVLGE